MAKVDLGDKQNCPECEKKFYDLAKKPAVCPYCSHSFDPGAVATKAAPVAASNVDEPEEAADENEEDIDADEAAAKELELDGDSATFGGNDNNDGDDNAPGTPDMDGFSSSDDEDEEEASSLDDDEDEGGPPTGDDDDDDDDVEEVEI